MRRQLHNRWVRRGALLAVLAAACGDTAPPAPAPASSPYPDDPGYVLVDRTLPRLRFQGQWFRRVGDGEPEAVSLRELAGQRVILEGKMLLEDTEPYPDRFLLGPAYPGCAHPDLHELEKAVIDVSLPTGRRVMVTDRLLWVEGTLEPSAEAGIAMRLVDARVQRLSAMRPEDLPKQ